MTACKRGVGATLCSIHTYVRGGTASDVSFLGRAYRREAARLLDTYPNACAQGQFHSIDDMIVTEPGAHVPDGDGPRGAAGDDRGQPALLRAQGWTLRQR